jgi:hypothetical protein
MDTPEVRVGQTWVDNDKRSKRTRYVRVTGFEEHTDPFTHHTVRRAICEAWYDEVGSTSRTVRIKVDRFKPTSTGYRLVSEPDGE